MNNSKENLNKIDITEVETVKAVKQTVKQTKIPKEKIYKTNIENKDRIRKIITNEQKKAIIELYNTQQYTKYRLSKIFGISETTVKRIVDPVYAEDLKIRNRKYNQTHIRPKEKRAEEMKRLKQRKIELYNQGLLKIDE